MKKKCYPTLVKAAENITQTELCQAPELSTLVGRPESPDTYFGSLSL